VSVTADPGLRTRPATAYDVEITDGEFRQIRELLYAATGITLGPQKRHLVRARLARRLRALGLDSFGQYGAVLLDGDPAGEEMRRFVNAMTTNKTDFFREAHHFRYLTETWAPAIRARVTRGDGHVRLWSAGCSTGEEPYTLAMTVREALGALPGLDLRILASDIDTDVLQRAAEGVYTIEQARPVPRELVARYFLRGVGTRADLVRVRPELRAMVTFRQINFTDDTWPIRARFDAIFCRNVLIYFDRPTQQTVLRRFLDLLKPDGLLFLGHSESVHGLLDDVAHLGQTIYQRAVTAARP
jgi:chemotaxis protein methyltransferase CheR